MTILTNEKDIMRYQLFTLKTALKLEVNTGMRMKSNPLKLLKSMGFVSRTKKDMLAEVENYLENN